MILLYEINVSNFNFTTYIDAIHVSNPVMYCIVVHMLESCDMAIGSNENQVEHFTVIGIICLILERNRILVTHIRISFYLNFII